MHLPFTSAARIGNRVHMSPSYASSHLSYSQLQHIPYMAITTIHHRESYDIASYSPLPSKHTIYRNNHNNHTAQ